MPPGAPFNSFALPYPIRVDCFSTIPLSAPEPHNAALHLLSHTHSDHIVGLQAKTFGQTVVCSASAKEMLLKHEVYKERALHEEYRAEHNHTFRHLKVDPYIASNGEVVSHGTKDLLKVFSMNTPTEVELDGHKKVTITLFDANHCPGAVMFLIEGSEGTILHTGDFRAEPWFLESIKHNPYLQPYLASSNSALPRKGIGVGKTLEAIYLDTACVMQNHQVPTKDDAITGLIALLELYPSSTYFFINCWTWGYEDILKAIARAFNCKIHLDDYKHRIYSLLSSDPLLQMIGTTDPDETRFHACERFARCHHVNVDREGNSLNNDDDNLASEDTFDVANRVLLGETSHNGWGANKADGGAKKIPESVVVYINPVSSMTPEKWVEYQATTRKQLIRGNAIRSLFVPLSRHSPLPELQAFVSLFRPKRIIPNTLDSSLKNLDWAGIDRVFESCCQKLQPASAKLRQIIPPAPVAEHLLFLELARECKIGSTDPHPDDEDDVAVKNIVSDAGDGANLESRAMAKKWLAGPAYGVEPSILKGRDGRRVDVLRTWLGLRKWGEVQLDEQSSSLSHSGIHSDNVERKQRTQDYESSAGQKQNQMTAQRDTRHRRSSDDEFDSSDDEDDYGRTAHQLFASPEAGKFYDTHAHRERSSFSFDLSDEEDAAEVEASLTPTATSKGDLGSGHQSKIGIGKMTPESSPVRAVVRKSNKGNNKISMMIMNFVTSTPKPKQGPSSRLEPFALSQSPLIAQARSLHFTPSAPGRLPSPSNESTHIPLKSHKRSVLSKEPVAQMLESPIHLISSSPSLKSRARSKGLKPSSSTASRRRRSQTTNDDSSPLSSPLKDKKRTSNLPAVISLTLCEERPAKRFKEGPGTVSRNEDLDGPFKVVKRTSHLKIDPKSQSASSAISASSSFKGNEQKNVIRGSALHSPQVRSRTVLRVSVTSPAVLTSKPISPSSSPHKPYSRVVRSSPHRTKSELLDIQLRTARKAGLALLPDIAPAFEAKCAKLEQRRDHARLKEKNVVEYASAEVKLKRRRIEEFDQKICNNARWHGQNDDGVDWERSRMLQRRATEDLRQGRKPTFPLLQCVQERNNDDL